MDENVLRLPLAGWRMQCSRALAAVALFVLPALLLATPYKLQPFALLLGASAVLGVDRLWRSGASLGLAGRVLLGLATAVVALGLWSVWQFEQTLRGVENVSRFLLLPWMLLWACALRPPLKALWWGALLGLFATLAVAGWQVLDGLERARGWTNAIVLADMALVLMVLLVFCRPVARWGWVIAGMVAGCGVVLLSGSRGAWPALLLLLVAMALSVRWGRGRVRLMALAGLVLTATTALLTVPELREHTRLDELRSDVQRIEQGDVDSSAGARLERLQVAWDTFREKPWTGVGIGHFDRAMQRLPECQSSTVNTEPRCHLKHAHNDVAEWAATMGIAGLLLLLCVYGLPLWLFVRLHRRSGRPTFRGPAAAGVMVVAVYVLCGLTQSMFSHQITAGTYVVLVGVLAGLSLVDMAARRPGMAVAAQG